MKIWKKISIFVILSLVLCMALGTVAYAADAAEAVTEVEGGKLPMDLGDPKGEDPLDFNERLGYAVQGTVTGILMVFSVLALLTLILYVSKFVFYDIPNRNKEKKIAEKDARIAASIAATHTTESLEPIPEADQDDGELIAVITAAVAAMIDESEYKDEFSGGFRVVSFKRSAKSAWNRK